MFISKSLRSWGGDEDRVRWLLYDTIPFELIRDSLPLWAMEKYVMPRPAFHYLTYLLSHLTEPDLHSYSSASSYDVYEKGIRSSEGNTGTAIIPVPLA